MADSTNTDGEVDERDGMMVDWSDLTDEDRLVVDNCRSGAAAAAARGAGSGGGAPDDNESRAAAVLDALCNDTSSESDFTGFAPAEIEGSMMPTVEAMVDYPRMAWVKITKGRGTSSG